MKVKLIPKNIIIDSYSEDLLLDLPMYECLYIIRKLKACIKSYENDYIEVSEMNKNKQVFSEEFNIWFSQNEYSIL